MKSLFILIQVLAVVFGAGLVIESIEKPPKCERKAKHGDWLKVHYVGTFENNGEKFDSRFVNLAVADFIGYF